MRWILIAACTVGVSGCVVPHRDVMVFGTDTSFGLSVGADPASAQVTNITIGYKRREAVFMPLIVNGADSKVFCQEMNTDGRTCKVPPNVPALGADWSPKYNSGSKGVDPSVGGTTEENDTYSVFASFGGDTSAGTGRGRVAVAQFFATGIAAQRLGANPSAVRLVSTAEVDAEGEKAKGKVEAYEELGVATAEQHLKNLDAAMTKLAERQGERDRISDFVFSDDDLDARQARLDRLLTNAEIPPAYKNLLLATVGDRAAFEKTLKSEYSNFNEELVANIP